jgi:hypothetical protein
MSGLLSLSGGVQNHRELPTERVKLWYAELIMLFAL